MATVNEALEDEITQHSVYLTRFASGTNAKALALLKRSEARLVERLLSEDLTALSRTRQEQLLSALRKIISEAYTDATGALVIDLEGLSAYEVEYQLDLFDEVTPVRLDWVRPSAEQVYAAVNARPFQGKLLKEVWPELEASAWRRVRDTIRAGIVEGLTTDEIVRLLRGTAAQGYADGLLSKSRREIEAVVRTAVQHTANTAREYLYAQNTDLIKGVRFVATLDSRTTILCASKDGKVYEPGKGPRPPLHFNCRSTTAPIIKSWREMGFDIDELPEVGRASMDGQVPAGQDYDAWLRKRPETFQNEVLGQKRADLFRAGTRIDRFIDKGGREYTLDELKRREKEAWAKAA